VAFDEDVVSGGGEHCADVVELVSLAMQMTHPKSKVAQPSSKEGSMLYREG